MLKTHPVYATLDDPLFACGGKRVKTPVLKRVIARNEAISKLYRVTLLIGDCHAALAMTWEIYPLILSPNFRIFISINSPGVI